MNRLIRSILTAVVSLQLSGCFHVELEGPVPGAKVVITDLRTGVIAETNLRSFDEAAYTAQTSQRRYDKLTDIGHFIVLGNFFTDKTQYTNNTLYLVTVTGGMDMDANGDLKEDSQYTPVKGSWHAILQGQQLRTGKFVISPITESLYQSVKPDISGLDDMALMQRLDQNTKTILDDVNEDGQVNYVDALTWSGLIHKDNYLLNFERVEKLSLAITQGASNVEVRTLALAVLEDESQLSLQFFTDNISMSIVQSKCVNCHVGGGVGPERGARHIFTTNSNSNHIAINHQVFIDFAGLSSFRTQDFSDYVSAKASGQSFHFGGVQLAPGSTALNNLKTYLNMIE
jgi:hypothetical protein